MGLDGFALAAIENTKWLTTMAVDGLTDAEMVFQPKEGMNHPTWLLGHIMGSADGLILNFCKGKGLLPADWQAKFGIGSKPSANAKDYPSRDEMLALLEKIHAAVVEYVRSLKPEDYDRKGANVDHLPERPRRMFGTIGKCLIGHVTHAAGHAAQIGMLRRLMGKAPRV